MFARRRQPVLKQLNAARKRALSQLARRLPDCLKAGLLTALLLALPASAGHKNNELTAPHPSPGEAISLSPQQQAYLQQLGQVRICVEPNWMPFEHVTTAGHYEGLLADYARLFSERLKISFVRQPTANYQESLQALKAGTCDIIVAEVATEDKLRDFLASKPYFISPRAFAVHMTQPFIADFTHISQQRIGVLRNSPAQSLLPQIYPGLEPLPFDSTDLGLQQVASGEISAFVNLLGALTYSIQHQGLSNVKIGGALPGNVALSVLVNKSQPQLVGILDQAIDSISLQERQQIFNRWISVKVEHGFNWPLFWSIIGGISLVAILVTSVFFRWNRLLQREMERRYQAEQEIRRLALTDSLTGLSNRNSFFQRFREAISLADRQQHELGLLWLDLDKFKPVNDTYGHPAGDRLLKTLAERLAKASRESDMVARMGGDEFAVLVINPESQEALCQVAERLVSTLLQPVDVAGHQVSIGVSIGIAIYPEQGISSTMLIENADKALYEAKRMGGNRYRIYNASTATISRPLATLDELNEH